MPRRKRRPPREPDPEWTPEEEAKLIEVSELGLDFDHWQTLNLFPRHRPGGVLRRRLELREAGLITYPRPI